MDNVSPLTGGPIELLRTVSVEHLSSLYRRSLNFDLRPFFDVEAVHLFRCLDTGYEFFAPGDCAGSPEFYKELYENAEWAYQETKWEYGVAASFLKKDGRILDVGSGAGQFLASVQATERVGLETNYQGREATPAGIVGLDETVEIHAASKSNYYDVVTAIQVLEHIYDVRSFLESCCTLLRPGGTLVLSVPNNEGFVGAQELPLNMPPHHMGRWTRSSLSAIAPLLKLELIRVEFEPLQEKNLGWYKSWIEQEYLANSRIAKSLFHRLGFSDGLQRWLEANRSTIMGHTVLAAFTKPKDIVA